MMAETFKLTKLFHTSIMLVVIIFFFSSASISFAGNFIVKNISNQNIPYFAVNGSSGFVGRGILSPRTPLHINTTGSNEYGTTPLIDLTSDNNFGSFLGFMGDGSGTEYFAGRLDPSVGDAFVIGRAGIFKDIIMKNNSYIGLGTPPLDEFEIYDFTNDVLSEKSMDYVSSMSYIGFNAYSNDTNFWRIRSATANGAVFSAYITNDDNTAFRFSFVDRSTLTITNITTITKSGYFGINTLNPVSPLDVVVPKWTHWDTNNQHVIFGVDSSSGYGLRIGFNGTYGVINTLKPSSAWGDVLLIPSGGVLAIGNGSLPSTNMKMYVYLDSTANPHIALHSVLSGSGAGAAIRADSYTTGTNSNPYNTAGYFLSNGATTGTNVAIYGYAANSGGYYALVAAGSQLCYDGSSGACMLNDIAEEWHSEKSIEKYDCSRNNNTGELFCNLKENFELEFHNGDVVCALEGKKNILRACKNKYDKSAIGVISANPTFVLGGSGPYKVALAGNVPINVICDEPVEVGDLLVYSGIKNYAMKLIIGKKDSIVDFHEKSEGIVAKALENCESGRKTIRAWI